MRTNGGFRRIISLILAIVCGLQLMLPAVGEDMGRTTGGAALGESTLGESTLGASTLGVSTLGLRVGEALAGTWISTGTNDNGAMDRTSADTLDYRALLTTPGSGYKIVVTVPAALTVKSYYAADPSNSDSNNPFSAVARSTDASTGDTILTYMAKSGFSGLAGVTVDVGINGAKMYNNMPISVEAELRGTGGGVDTVLATANPVTSTASVGSGTWTAVIKQITQRAYNNGNPISLSVRHTIGGDYLNGSIYPYTSVSKLDLNKIKIKMPSAAVRTINAAELACISVVIAGGAGSYDPAAKIVTFNSQFRVTWGSEQAFSLIINDPTDTVIPNGSELIIDSAALAYDGYINNFNTEPNAYVTAGINPYTIYVYSASLPETGLSLSVGSTNNAVLRNADNQQLFRILLKNPMCAMKEMSFQVQIPSGVTVTHIGLPSSYNTTVRGPVTVTVGGMTQTLVSGTSAATNRYYALDTPVTGNTMIITIGEVPLDSEIWYADGSANAISYGIRFLGKATTTAGTFAVAILNTAGEMTAYVDLNNNGTYTAVKENIRSYDTVSRTVNVRDTVTKDVQASGIQFRNSAGTAVQGSANPSDVVMIYLPGLTKSSYPYTNATYNVDYPVLYFTVPAEFCDPRGGHDWTAADVYSSGLSIISARTVKDGSGGYLSHSVHSGSKVVEVKTGPLWLSNPPPASVSPGTQGYNIGLRVMVDPGQVTSTGTLTLDHKSVLVGNEDAACAGSTAGYSMSSYALASLLGSANASDYGMGSVNSGLAYPGTSYSAPTIGFTEGTVVQMQAEMEPGDGVYVSYIPGSGNPLPTMSAEGTGTFQISISNATFNTLTGVTGYFILPRYVESGAVKWKTLANGQLADVTSWGSITPSAVTVSYTSEPFVGTKAMSDMSSVSWSGYSSGMEITAIKFELATLPGGITYRAELPFKVPALTGGINYNDEAIGQTLYDMGTVPGFGSVSAENGPTAALKLIKSNAPVITPALTSAITYVEYKLEAVPANWNSASYTDDISTVASAAGYPKATFTPEGGTASAVNSIANSAKGTYDITFRSTVDGDYQYTEETRRIVVKDTTPAVLSAPTSYAIGIGANTLAYWSDYFKSNAFLTVNDSQDTVDWSKVILDMGSFDPNSYGSYTIRLGYTDPAGNASAPVTSIIHVGILGPGGGTVPVLTAPDKSIVLGSAEAGTYTWISEINASDLEDGNLTSSVILTSVTDVYGNTATPSKTALAAAGIPNRYTANYSVADSSGNTVTKSRVITVGTAGTSGGLSPWIEAPDKDLALNASCTWGEDAKAYDPEDGEITSSLTLVSVVDIYGTATNPALSGSVPANAPNQYTVSYRVTDSDGNTATKSRIIRVGTSGSMGLNPWIAAPDKSLMLNASYTWGEDVRAYDPEDGVITSALTLVSVVDIYGAATNPALSGSVPASAPNRYTVHYRVTDSDGNIVTKSRVITVGTAGTSGGLSPWIEAPDKDLALSASYTWDQDVRAYDPEDGEITSSLTLVSVVDIYGAATNPVLSGSVPASAPNRYTVSYRVTDSDGNTVTESRVIKVGDQDGSGKYKPWIATSDVNLAFGASYTWLTDVKAWDIEDGELTASVAVTGIDDQLYGGTVSPSVALSTTVPGKYKVYYSVTDSDGNTVAANRIINVGEKDSSGRYKPWIEAPDKNLSIGDSYTLMTDVKGHDIEDGDITSSVIVTSLKNMLGDTVPVSAFTTAVAGRWIVSYQGSDSDGNIATRTRTIKVGDQGGSGQYIPWITASDKDLTRNTGYTWITDVKGYDLDALPSADVTSKITVTSVTDLYGAITTPSANGSVPTGAPNYYTVSYRLVAENGNIATASRVIRVGDQDSGGRYKPWIEASDKSLSQGDAYNWNSEVRAYDLESAPMDISSSVTVTQVKDIYGVIMTPAPSAGGAVPTGAPNRYEVQYSVTGAYGTATASRVIKVGEQDGGGKYKPWIVAPDKDLTLNASYSLPADVTAWDIEDGNLTSKIKVTQLKDITGAAVSQSAFTTSAPGKWTVSYSVTDNDGNTATASRVIKVGEQDGGGKYKPWIAAPDKELAFGVSYTWLSEVEAWDIEDGDITSLLTITGIDDQLYGGTIHPGTALDTRVPGKYKVYYSVMDSDGNAVTANRAINVGEKDGNGRYKPWIEAPDKELAIGDGYTLMTDVHGYDIEDGTISVSVTYLKNMLGETVPESAFTTAAAGKWTVSYQGSDSDGNVAAATRTVKVGDFAPGGGYLPWIVAPDKDLTLNESYAWMSDVKAYDIDADPVDITDRVTITSIVNLYGASQPPSVALNTGVPNKYNVSYRVTDGDGNTVMASRVIKVGDQDGSGKYKPWIIAPNAYLSLNDSYALLDDVEAWDMEDGDIGGTLSVTKVVDLTGTAVAASAFTTAEKGLWTVSYSAKDSDGNLASGSRVIKVGDKDGNTDSDGNATYLPWLTAPDIELPLNAAYTWLTDVTAYDLDDGDLTSKVEIVSVQDISGKTITRPAGRSSQMVLPALDTGVPNRYTVSYEVMDSDGNVASASRVIQCAKSDGKGGHEPWIIAPDKARGLREHYGIMSGIEAWDIEDGNLTGSVKIIKVLFFGREIPVSQYKSTGAGFWTVTYEVTDSDGNTVEAVRSISQNSSDSGSNGDNTVQTDRTTSQPGSGGGGSNGGGGAKDDAAGQGTDSGAAGGGSADLEAGNGSDRVPGHGEDDDDDAPGSEANPSTGDDAPLSILVSVAVFSLVTLIIMTMGRSRRKRAKRPAALIG